MILLGGSRKWQKQTLQNLFGRFAKMLQILYAKIMDAGFLIKRT